MFSLRKVNFKSDCFCKKLLVAGLFFTTNVKAVDYIHVVHLGETSKSLYFVINRGTDSNFNVGEKVCVYDLNPTEEVQEPLLCEPIILANEKLSSVKMSKEESALVSLNQVVAKEGEQPQFPREEEFGTEVEGEAKFDSKSESLIKATQEIAQDPTYVTSNLTLGLPMAIIAPVQFYLPKFNSTQFGTKGSSSWDSGTAVNRSYIGFYAAYEKALKNNWILRPEFVYQFFPMTKVQTDFDPTNLNTSVESHAVANFYELRLTALKAKKISDHWHFDFGPGLSLARSQVKFSATAEKSSGTDDSYAVFNSLVHVLMVDGLTTLSYQGSWWRAETGLNLAIPVVEFGKSIAGSSDTDSAASSNDSDSISQALVHKKNAFGFSAFAGLGFNF